MLLTDEEMRWSKGKIVDIFGKPYETEDVYNYAKRVADLVSETNTKAQLKKVVEWFMDNCDDVTGDGSIEQILAIPKYKLQALLKEIE